MKTIKIESSFWVGDIVYGIVTRYNESDKLELSIEKFVIKEVVTTPEDGLVKIYHIDNVAGGRGFRCGTQFICSWFTNPMNLVHEVEISSETAGVLIDNDGVKKCLLYASDGVNTKEYK